MTSSPDQQQKLENFIQWFRDLDFTDQAELMALVHSEHQVRDVVRGDGYRAWYHRCSLL